jgi:hypothetical protein
MKGDMCCRSAVIWGLAGESLPEEIGDISPGCISKVERFGRVMHTSPNRKILISYGLSLNIFRMIVF